MLNRHRRNSVNNERREHCAAIQEPSMGRAGPSAAHGPVCRSTQTSAHIVVVYNANTTDVEADEASSSWKYFTKEGRFAFNLIHPNGTGFPNVLNSSPGWINHPCFNPDSKSLLFT
jgi:hypothetical protein